MFRTIRNFVISGCIVAFVQLGLMALLLAVGVHYLVASVISYLIGLAVNFLLQKYFVFLQRGGKVHAQATLFFINSGLNLLLSSLAVFGLVEYAGVSPLGAQVVAIAVLMVYNFNINRLLFRS